jgi:hypothetical protein
MMNISNALENRYSGKKKYVNPFGITWISA